MTSPEISVPEPEKHGLAEILERLQLLPDRDEMHRRVAEIRAENPAESMETFAQRQVTATVVRCTGVGVVAGLPGTIPGLGTFAQACATLGIAGGEAALLLRSRCAIPRSSLVVILSALLPESGYAGHCPLSALRGDLVVCADISDEMRVRSGLALMAAAPMRAETA